MSKELVMLGAAGALSLVACGNANTGEAASSARTNSPTNAASSTPVVELPFKVTHDPKDPRRLFIKGAYPGEPILLGLAAVNQNTQSGASCDVLDVQLSHDRPTQEVTVDVSQPGCDHNLPKILDLPPSHAHFDNAGQLQPTTNPLRQPTSIPAATPTYSDQQLGSNLMLLTDTSPKETGLNLTIAKLLAECQDVKIHHIPTTNPPETLVVADQQCIVTFIKGEQATNPLPQGQIVTFMDQSRGMRVLQGRRRKSRLF